jgi:hypothetical protein
MQNNSSHSFKHYACSHFPNGAEKQKQASLIIFKERGFELEMSKYEIKL